MKIIILAFIALMGYFCLHTNIEYMFSAPFEIGFRYNYLSILGATVGFSVVSFTAFLILKDIKKNVKEL